MEWETEIHDAPLSPADLTFALRRSIEAIEFEPDSDIADVLQAFARGWWRYRSVMATPEHWIAIHSDKVLSNAQAYVRAYPDLIDVRDKCESAESAERCAQLRSRARAMIQEVYARRPAVLAALDQQLAAYDEETSVTPWRHEPTDYYCPFCALVKGASDDINDQRDIVLTTARATAFVAPRWWPNNQGHVLVIPNAHHENIYDLPPIDGYAVQDAVREIATAMRTSYGCEGISTRQHNEPAGNQDVWHLHVHVFPRYNGDQLYQSKPLPGYVTQAERAPYAQRLRDQLTLSRTQAR